MKAELARKNNTCILFYKESYINKKTVKNTHK